MPARYHKIHMKLTKAQYKKLLSGGPIQVHKHHIGGSVPFHLTKTQVEKMARHFHAGKGARIHLSMTQIKHHHKMGHGFFDTIKSGLSKLKPLLPLAKEIGKIAAPHLIGALPEKYRSIASAGSKALGLGLRRTRRRMVRHRTTGSSFRTIGGATRRRVTGSSFHP